MRRHLVWVLASSAALGTVAIAQALNTQTVQVTVSPHKKLPKKGTGKSVKAKLTLSTRDAADPAARPTAGRSVNIDFDKDLRLFTKGLKRCNPSSIASATTEAAIQKCGKTKVSVGRTVPYGSGTPQNAAVVRTPVGDIPAAITVFNGTPSNGRPRVLVHTVNSVSGTTLLEATLVKGPAGYGESLLVVSPPVAGDQASIIDFTVTVKKSFKYKGDPHGFVQATCKDRKIKSQARARFADGSTASGTFVQSCTGKA